MKNEKYLWVAFFVIVIAVALYFRFYSSPSYQLSVSFNRTLAGGRIYPYQNIRIPITVVNTGGSAISGLDLGLYVNGSTENIYKVDIPEGKSVIIPFNYTPKNAGFYNLSVVADPGNVVPLSDRAAARSATNFTVSQSQNPAPYQYINSNGLEAGSYADLDSSGVVTASFIYSNFTSIPLTLSNISSLNGFMYPITSIAGSYMKELSYANGAYAKGHVSSIWIRGYLVPAVITYAAEYKGLQSRNITVNGTGLTFVRLDNYSTLCSWYSGGWIKIIGTNGTLNCTSLVAKPPELHYMPSSENLTFAANSIVSNALGIGAYSGFNGNVFSIGKMFELNDSIHYLQKSTNMTSPFLVCYGAIYNISNVSYCSTYAFPRSGKIGPFSLTATRAYIGSVNITDFAIANTSKLIYSVPESVEAIQALHESGKPYVFLSGIANSCGFVQGFNCTDAAYSNSTLKFKLINNYNQSVELHGGLCYLVSPTKATRLNYTVNALGSANVSLKCYYNSTVISGIPFNLNLGIVLNYTSGNSFKQAFGRAYIV